MTAYTAIILGACIFLIADVMRGRYDWATVLLGLLVLVFGFMELRDKMRRVRRVEPRDLRRELSTIVEVGDRRYSPFFESDIEIVEYKNDEHYRFKILHGPKRGLVFRNQSPWSALPLTHPPKAAPASRADL